MDSNRIMQNSITMSHLNSMMQGAARGYSISLLVALTSVKELHVTLALSLAIPCIRSVGLMLQWIQDS